MFRKLIPLLVPYATVGAGLHVFHSAWVAIFSYHMGMLCVILLSKNKPRVRQLFKSNNYKAPVIMAVIGAGGGSFLFLLAPSGIPDSISSYTYSIGLTERTWLLFIVYYVFATPLIEEYYWRGLLSNHSSKCIMPTDLFFAGYHLLVLAGKIGFIWLPVIFVVLSLTAWLWRHVNKISGGLLPSVLSHFTADISVILAIYWIAVHR